jgi:hypothetical protein
MQADRQTGEQQYMFGSRRGDSVGSGASYWDERGSASVLTIWNRTLHGGEVRAKEL